MAVKILVTGDVHIGRRSGSVEGNPSYAATKYTWERMVELAVDKRADILALTGDIVDRENRFFEAVGPLHAGFERLGEAGIEVFVVAGNHDYDVLAEIMDVYRYPHVRFLGRNGQWEFHDFQIRDQHLVFAGWSFPSRFVNDDPLRFFPDAKTAEVPVVGMIHGDVDVPASRYAPMNSTGFLNRGVDVWLLGHIHKPHILRHENPLIFYPGSPHALSAGEKGVHGPVLLTIRGKQDIEYETLPLSPVRYEFLEIDITGMTAEEVRGRIVRAMMEDGEALELKDLKILKYDLVLTGHHGNMRAVEWELERTDDLDQMMGGCSVGIRKVDFSGVKAKVDDPEDLARQKSPVGRIAGVILALEQKRENEMLTRLRREVGEGYNRMMVRNTYIDINPVKEEEKEEFIDKVILHQCHQLLSELLSQKEEV